MFTQMQQNIQALQRYLQFNFPLGGLSATPGQLSNWISITSFLNGWSASTSYPPGVLLDSAGIVRFKGMVQGGTSASEAFQLPPGFFPVQDDYWAALTSGGAAGTYVEVTSAGVVIPTCPSPTSNGVWLNSISFPAAS